MNPSRMRKTVGGIALSFVLAVVIGISGVIAPGGGTALGASTTLTILGGEVQVSRDGGAFVPAADGAIIGPGDVIRTSADSRAVLTYFEGSTVSVEPSSELAIDEASSSPDGSTVLVMTQNLGRTWHVVTKLITGGSRYEVRTPAATASVRGTAFAVGVAADASGKSVTEISTTEGAVAASAPPTTADPQPEPVVVAAGFQATATSGERTLQAPTPAPEPERKVTVTVGSANSLVVDPLGRSNGFKDGKLVLQTPGAQVIRTAGTLLITLPNLPDGKISTVVARPSDGSSSADVPVITTVQERGKPSTLVQDSVKPTETVSGIEMKKSGAGPDATPDVRRVTEDEKKDLQTPKTVVEPPKLEPARTRPGLGGDPSVITRIVEESRAKAGESKAGQSGDGESASKQRASESSASTSGDSGSTPRGQGFVQPLPFQGAPVGSETRLTDAKREDDKKAEQAEAQRKAAEQLERAAENAKRRAEAEQARAEEAKKRAEDDAKRAEERSKNAAEQAKLAAEARAKADDARRKADEEAAKAKDEAAKKALESESKRRSEEAAKADADRKAAEEARRSADEARRKAEQEAAQKAQDARRNEEAAKASEKLREQAEEVRKRIEEAQKRATTRNDVTDQDRPKSPGDDSDKGGGVKLPDIRLPGLGNRP